MNKKKVTKEWYHRRGCCSVDTAFLPLQAKFLLSNLFWPQKSNVSSNISDIGVGWRCSSWFMVGFSAFCSRWVIPIVLAPGGCYGKEAVCVDHNGITAYSSFIVVNMPLCGH